MRSRLDPAAVLSKFDIQGFNRALAEEFTSHGKRPPSATLAAELATAFYRTIDQADLRLRREQRDRQAGIRTRKQANALIRTIAAHLDQVRTILLRHPGLERHLNSLLDDQRRSSWLSSVNTLLNSVALVAEGEGLRHPSYATRPFRAAGVPRDELLRSVLVESARAFLAAGERPTRAREGRFAVAALVLYRSWGRSREEGFEPRELRAAILDASASSRG